MPSMQLTRGWPNRSLFTLTAGLAILSACVLPTSQAPDKRPKYSPGDLAPSHWLPSELGDAFATFEAWREQRQLVISDGGIVVDTAVAPAALAGAQALHSGGNAMDAALTTALTSIALSIGAPVSYAGISNLVYYDAASGAVLTLDAGWNTVRAEIDPTSIPTDAPSGRTALVPGFMAGVEAAHRRFGALPFAALFEPAIEFADRGFELLPMHARFMSSRRDVIARLPETRRLFTRPDGEPYEAGDLFRQPALAQTLRSVAAEGAAYMYTGAWAEKLVAAVQADGGHMTMADLASYEPTWAEPTLLRYGEHDLCLSGATSWAGANLFEAMALLDRAGLRELGRIDESAEALFWMMRILHVQHVMNFAPPALVAEHLPDIETNLSSRLTAEHADQLWAALRSPEWQGLLEAEALAAADDASQGSHTDAVVVVDRAGNVAALTFTINTVNWGRTGIFVDGVSISDAALSNRTAASEVGAGNRVPNSLNPLIVLRDGAPVLAWSAIGAGIHEATVQTLCSVLDFGLDPIAAAEAPQVHLYATPFLAEVLEGTPEAPLHARIVVEGEFDDALLEAVRARGQPVLELPAARVTPIRGWGVTATIDPVTGLRSGAASRYSGGLGVSVPRQ